MVVSGKEMAMDRHPENDMTAAFCEWTVTNGICGIVTHEELGALWHRFEMERLAERFTLEQQWQMPAVEPRQ
jgi:hypothetical protein